MYAIFPVKYLPFIVDMHCILTRASFKDMYWVGHLSQGTKNNVKRGPEKNRNFEKSKNRKIEKIEKSKNRNFADRNFLFDYFSIFHCPEREGKGIAEILRKEYWNKD